MGVSAQAQTPPPPPNVRAQQGPFPAGPQGPMTENAESIIQRIEVDVRKLAESLVKTKPAALETLKQILPMLSQLTSEVMGPEDRDDSTPAPPPTPGESLPPPTESAAPAGGYLPGA